VIGGLSWRPKAGVVMATGVQPRHSAGSNIWLICTFPLLSRYAGGMTEITVSDARARLADVVDAARVRHDPVYLTRRGQRVAAVIDAEDLSRLLEAAEDLADLQAARAARDEMAGGEAAIPWERVKADLGLA
jgi:antitoxin Phd